MKIIIAAVVATAIAVSGWTYAIARPAKVHDVTRTVTHTVTVTRWRTRVVHKTKTVTAGVENGSTTPCLEQNGTVVPTAGAAASGAPGLTTCSIAIDPDTPASDGDQLVITAPDGVSNSYQLGS